MAVKVLAFAGSARRDSLNKKLLRLAAAALLEAGALVTVVDLEDFPMPLYHGDLEHREGMPEHARRLRRLLGEHQGLLLVSPENNASVSSLLKNALDWMSRPDGGQNGLVPFQNKVALLMSASPGALGGLRGLVHLRQILQALSVLVLTEQLALVRAHEQFDGEGQLIDPKLRASLSGLAERFIGVVSRLAS
jgi:NAD(P)H-dependent FMN reductase